MSIRFGTDGIRGPAGQFPLDPVGAAQIGRGLADHLGGRGAVVIGGDTRQSTPMLTEALARGLCAGGVTPLLAGVLPTAGLSLLVPHLGAQAGVMVTASHNPWPDNGVKIVGPDGKKSDDDTAIEAAIAAAGPLGPPRASPQPVADPAGPWRAMMPRLDLRGLNLLLDCAHGAAAPHAPALLAEMGARLSLRGCDPDGRNINEGVGALHPPASLDGADLAICLDGDADRILLVDPQHGICDGDDILAWLALEGAGPVVGTVMTNGGLEAAFGGRLLRAPVGDRHVAAWMARSGATLGAEPSGHVLFSPGPPTGDGLYTALRVLQAAADSDGRPRLPLPSGLWVRWPQSNRNVRLRGDRRPLDRLESVAKAEAAGNRVVVRYSGTEPLLRILVEGPLTPGNDPAAQSAAIAAEVSSW
jgi:phosphoglucosamine mutase